MTTLATWIGYAFIGAWVALFGAVLLAGAWAGAQQNSRERYRVTRLVPGKHPNVRPNRWGVLAYDPWGARTSLTDADVVEIEASGTCHRSGVEGFGRDYGRTT